MSLEHSLIQFQTAFSKAFNISKALALHSLSVHTRELPCQRKHFALEGGLLSYRENALFGSLHLALN